MSRRTQLALLASTLALAAPVGAQAKDQSFQHHPHQQAYQHQPNAVAEGSRGAAATVDSVATNAALQVLKRQGNAVDAAVAAAAVLGVTEPFSSGVGGGGFMVIRTRDGDITTIDSREESPAAMRPDSFYPAGTTFNNARYSGLSAGVPGTVAGWEKALDEYGSWSFKRVLAPAIDVARTGFVIDSTFASQAAGNSAFFAQIPASEALYGDADAGEIQRNPDLARTYERIARLGADGFYEGPIAEAIVDAVHDVPASWLPGLMTEEDLADYEAIEREPTHIQYRGLDVYSMGPPSSGGSTVGEALNILEQLPKYQSGGEAQKLHDFLEASRFAFADRNACVADPEFYPVPLATLLSDQFAAQRAAKIDESKAAISPVAPGLNCPKADGTFQPTQSTTHITVADDDGMVVSYTFTIESTGGNGIVVPGWGILLNNELTDFNYLATEANHPNQPDGGKRPRSSMAPTIIEDDGEPFVAVGSPGGSTIITTVLQIIAERVDFGRTLPEAIADPRASQRNTPTVAWEAQFPTALLTPFGHVFAPTPAEIGAATGIEWLPSGELQAVAEPVRRGGGAAGALEWPGRGHGHGHGHGHGS
jgi:gamma-glutamyltranspeptidase/glutathione hydrolase